MTLMTGSWLLDAVLLLVPLLYWYMTRNFGYWKKLGIPYWKPTPFVGNMGSVVLGRKHMGEPVLECYHMAGDARFMGMFAFDQPLLMVKDPALVGRIMSTDFSTFYATNAKIDPVADPVIGMSLFGQHGPGWKKLRTVLSPAFTSGKIKLMFHLVNEVGQNLTRLLETEASKGSAVELKDVMARYTTDVVCSIFMGVNAGSLEDPNSLLRVNLRDILRENLVGRMLTTLLFFAPKLMSFLHIRAGSKKVEDYFVQNTGKLIEHRKEHGIVRNDVVDLLLKIKEDRLSDDEDSKEDIANEKAKAGDKKLKLTNELIAGQLMSFLNAGFDTSSSTMSFCLYELARNAELQEEVRQHVRQVLKRHGGQPTYEALNEMTDLTNVVNEALRMYPPVNFHDREASRDYKIPGTDIVLPKGTGVIFSVTGLHNDPRYWKEPHRFMPDRFREENSKDRPSYTFLPFGEGPRLCIGMRVAYLQIKLGLVHILNNFEVLPAPDTPSSLRYEPSKFIGTPAGKVALRFRKVAAP
ncbi:cytochrome P450 6j1-like [Schistocerca cancellata]|uniref:cytochrome P450 6j1-like n=1 Tax=Schistocerca cancellata TaxID=274614 RepID=UPI0021182CFF|nr:cytochrome P450 6j1-like [Schistocerca cancellata]